MGHYDGAYDYDAQEKYNKEKKIKVKDANKELEDTLKELEAIHKQIAEVIKAIRKL